MPVLQPQTKERRNSSIDHPTFMFQRSGVYCTLLYSSLCIYYMPNVKYILPKYAYILYLNVAIHLLYSTLPYPTLLYPTLLCSALLYSTLLYSTLLYSTLLYSTLLYSTLLHRWSLKPGARLPSGRAGLRLLAGARACCLRPASYTPKEIRHI